MKKLHYIIIIFFLLPETLFSQVEINRSIIFNSPDSAKNSITGLADPISKNNAIRIFNPLYQNLNYSSVIYSNDTFYITNSFIDTLQNGTWIVFKSNDTCRGNCQIKLTNFPSYPIINAEGNVLNKSFIYANQELICMFYNGQFLLMSNEYAACPPGFVDINREYCIQKHEQQQGLFFEAIDYCMSLNARLCNWSEWYYACVNAGTFGLTNMTTNYEFLDDSADHTTSMTFIGSGSNCKAQNNISSTSSGAIYEKNYRCCYDKK